MSGRTAADAAARVSAKALAFIVRQRPRWRAGVESAEVLLALHDAGLGGHQFSLDAADEFRQQQLTDGASAGSWDSDFDTTAYGIMVAAAYPGVLDDAAMGLGAEFVLRDFGGTRVGTSWSDEVGKTLLGLRALAAARHPRLAQSLGPSHHDKSMACCALDWLRLATNGDALLINERYSAEFVAATRELGDIYGTSSVDANATGAAAEMRDSLLRVCDEELGKKGVLWNNDLRANGIALEAMAEQLAEGATPEVLVGVVNWFENRQQPDGSFGTILATARIVQGLALLQFRIARQGGMSAEQASAAVAQAHRGVTEGIPLALLWKSMQIQHDEDRQARVLVVPDRVWQVFRWCVFSLVPALFGLTVWLFGDAIKMRILTQ